MTPPLRAGDLEKRLPAAALQNSDTFRTKYCYLMQTDAVLRKHYATLRAIYERYCDVREFPVVGGLDNMRCMSLEEFINLLDHMGVFEAKQVSAKLVRAACTVATVLQDVTVTWCSAYCACALCNPVAGPQHPPFTTLSPPPITAGEHLRREAGLSLESHTRRR